MTGRDLGTLASAGRKENREQRRSGELERRFDEAEKAIPLGGYESTPRSGLSAKGTSGQRRFAR